MPFIKYYIFTCCIFICSVVFAQDSEDWLPADTVYQWGIEAQAEHDKELSEQCSLYLWNASKHYLNQHDYQTAIKYAFAERDLTIIIYGINSHQ